MSRSSYFGHIDKLIGRRFLLEGIGWQVFQCGVRPHTVVETDDVVGNVAHRFSMVGVVVLPNALHLQVQEEAPHDRIVPTISFAAHGADQPVPIDMRAIRALKKSPLALDIYSWPTYRMSYLKSPTVVSWAGVAMMLGSSYAKLRDFKKAFLNELRKVQMVYPNVNVELLPDGLRIKPSLTHIPKATR